MSTYAPTIERAKYAKEVVDSLDMFLECDSDIDWRLLLADDGTPDTIYGQYYDPIVCNKVSVPRMGIGGSLNAALKLIHPDEYVMYITDDWVLTDYLEIQPAIDLLKIGYDYVRINPLHPNLACTTKFHAPIGWWLELHQTHGGFAFATRPFIATRKFFDKVGKFKEYTDAYVTEQDYAERVSHMPELRLAALVDMHGSWSHIGEYEVGKIQLVPHG